MKIKKFNFENKEMIQIYVDKIDYENFKVKEKINEIKKKYSNTYIFINGKNDTVKTIREMLNYEKSKNVK